MASGAVRLKVWVGQAIELREVKSIGKSQPVCRVYLNRSDKCCRESEKTKGLSPRFDMDFSLRVPNPKTADLRFAIFSDSGKIMGEATVSVASIVPGAPPAERWLKLQVVDHDRTADADRGTLQVRFSLPYLVDQRVLVNESGAAGAPWTVARIVRVDPLEVQIRGRDPQEWDLDRVKPVREQDLERVLEQREEQCDQHEAALSDRERRVAEREEGIGAQVEAAEAAAAAARESEERAAEKLAQVEEQERALEEAQAALQEQRDALAEQGAELQRRAGELDRRGEQLAAAEAQLAEQLEEARRKEAASEELARRDAEVQVQLRAEVAALQQRRRQDEAKADKFRQALRKQQQELGELMAATSAQEEKLGRYKLAVEKLRKDNAELRERAEQAGETLGSPEGSPAASPVHGPDAARMRETMERLMEENAALRAEHGSPPGSPCALPSSPDGAEDRAAGAAGGAVDAARAELQRLAASGEAAEAAQLQQILRLLSAVPRTARRRHPKDGPVQTMATECCGSAEDAAAAVMARRDERRRRLLDAEANRQAAQQQALSLACEEVGVAHPGSLPAPRRSSGTPRGGAADGADSAAGGAPSRSPSSAGLSSSAVCPSDDDAVARLEALQQRGGLSELARADIGTLWAQYRERPRDLHQLLADQNPGVDRSELAWLLTPPARPPADPQSPPAALPQQQPSPGGGAAGGAVLEVFVEGAGPLQEVKVFGTSSPHCVLELEGRRCQTDPQDKTLTPTFNAPFSFPVAAPDQSALMVSLLNGQKLMGECVLRNLAQLPRGAEVSRALPLRGPKDGPGGHVRLRLKASGFGAAAAPPA